MNVPIYKNLHSSKELKIDKVNSEVYRLNSSFTNPEFKQYDFWSFQGGSYRSRPDWIVPVVDNFSQENYQGMNAREYGGGTPVTDLWNRTMGMAVAHIEPIFKPVNLPVEVQSDKQVRIGVIFEQEDNILSPEEEYQTIMTMVLVHDGDCYNGLSVYSSLMQKQGLTFEKFSDGSYEPIWCGWGYGEDFTLNDMYGTLPKVKELGFKWAVLDYGWENNNGDWLPIKSKLPNGEKDMKAFVEKVKEMGMKPKLWCVPFDADTASNLAKEHPDWFVLNKDGEKVRISFWNTFFLCPAVPEVQEYQVELARRYIEDWGFDGLKIDGMCLNLAPPCYNPAHKHKSPYESCEKTAEVMRKVFEKAKLGDKKALAIFKEYGTHLGEAIKTIMFAVDPEAIILGGSVCQSYPLFQKTMWEQVQTFPYQNSIDRLVIERSDEPHIAILGAAALYYDSLPGQQP